MSVAETVSNALEFLEEGFYRIPGSAVVDRYVRSSYKNDPGRSLLELILIVFAVRTLLQSRTRSDATSKNFVQLSEKEIDELVDEWRPEPLVAELTDVERIELNSVPVIQGPVRPKSKLANGKSVTNLASYNFTGLADNADIQERAIDTLRKYGLGSCGPPGFYGTVDVHLDLEKAIAEFIGTESAILYSQSFSTITSVIPAFCKRGDIIVADRGVNFAIHKGIQLSRSTVRWYDHNDIKSLEDVLQSINKEQRKRRAKLTRRFIITEGVFENDGQMVDLPKLIELKQKYKYRMMLDESISFGTIGRTGRGLTEHYNVLASQIDMLIGSVANGLGSCGGFCAGSEVVVNHQRINGTSYVFSASMPPLLAVAGTRAIAALTDGPGLLNALHENIKTIRSVLSRTDGITIPSHPLSPIIHITLRSSPASPSLPLPPSTRPNNPTSLPPREPSAFDIESEERILQEAVDEALSQGVLITRAKRLRGQEPLEPRPSIRLAATAGLSRKDTEKAAGVVKAAFQKVLQRRR